MLDPEPQRHIVVFDCNIYLDVADLLTAPFTWQKFDVAAVASAKDPVPHPNAAVDGLRSIAMCSSGKFAGEETLEVWTSAHIDTLVRAKAQHPVRPATVDGHRGLGWNAQEAQDLIDSLIDTVIERSNGGTLGDLIPDGNPPLDHEDGMVFGACRELAREDPLSNVYCVTRDGGFLSACREGRLSNHTRVMHPSTFVQLVRSARRQYAQPPMP